MRITPTIQNRNFLSFLELTKSRLDQAQAEISSGKRVDELSDDPYAAARATNIASLSSENAEYIRSNENLKDRLNYTDTTLQSLIRMVERAKVVAMQALSGSTDASTRQALAAEVGGLRQQVFSVANSQYNGIYLFSGTARPVPAPFVDNSGTVTYNGNTEAVYQRIDRSTAIPTNLTGQEVFLSAPSVFDTLQNLKQAIQANDVTAITNESANLDNILLRLNSLAAEIGNRVQTVDQTLERLRAEDLALTTESSRLTDANLVESISRFNLANQAVNVSLNAQAKVQQLSLIDYLR